MTPVTLNDPRRVATDMRFTATNLPIELRLWYRQLRLAGFERRDANLLVIGAAAGMNAGHQVNTDEQEQA